MIGLESLMVQSDVVEEKEVKYLDPFDPELKLENPHPLDVSDEQRLHIKAILDTACSDSRFAAKAYDALMLVLTTEAVTPVIATLSPDNAPAGNPSISIIVSGANFDSGAVVHQAGVPVNTTFVSDIEVTATLDLSGATEGSLAISVRNSNGITSNVVNFTVLAPLA